MSENKKRNLAELLRLKLLCQDASGMPGHTDIAIGSPLLLWLIEQWEDDQALLGILETANNALSGQVAALEKAQIQAT